MYRDPEQYRPSNPGAQRNFENSLFDYVDVTLSKHGGNEASNDANVRIAASKGELRLQIYEFALLNEKRGITLKEVVSRLRIPIQTASARLSELKRDGVLQALEGQRRDDCSVLVPVYAK